MAILKEYGDPDALFNNFANKNKKQKAIAEQAPDQAMLTDEAAAPAAPVGSRQSKN